MEKQDLLFWTDIFLDHAVFQINAFSPKEGEYISTAEKFYYVFQKWNKALKAGEHIDIHSLENDAKAFVSFKKTIIYELLEHNLLLNFSPSFMNHMVNEGNEFLSILNGGTCPPETKKPTTYIKTWLSNTYDHTFALASFLDLSERPSIQRVEMFGHMLDKLVKKTVEMEMIESNLDITIKADLLQEEAIEVLEDFIALCKEIGTLLNKKKIMGIGTLSQALTEHFIEEQQYSINKIRTCM